MSSQAVPTRITRYVAAFAVMFAVVTFVVGGVAPGVGAAIGGTVAVLNWVFLRWVTEQVTRGSMNRQAGLMFLLVLKFGVLIAVCWALIVRWHVHAVGFSIGLSALVAAVFLGSAMSAVPLSAANREEA